MNIPRFVSALRKIPLKLKQSLTSSLTAKPMKDISDRFHPIQASTRSALGRSLMSSESEALAAALQEYRGKKVLLLSAIEGLDLKPASAFQSLHKLQPAVDEESLSVFGRFDALPIDSASYDIVIVQHVLEYSTEPQQVLKEAARVTKHGGHMVIVGFNPLSSHGFWSFLVRNFKPESFWRRKSLFMYRVKDWLKFLDFCHLQSLNLAHFPPINSEQYLAMMKPVSGGLNRVNFPFSSVYCLVSRKDEPGMIMTRSRWKQSVFQSALPGSRPAPIAGGLAKVHLLKDYKPD